MNKAINFVLLREGTSDDGLLAHLQELVVRSGATSAVGSTRDYRGSVRSRISAVIAEKIPVDLVFVHRDADSLDAEPRYEEIRQAAAELPHTTSCISVVPVQELEAWLLVDQDLIREVAGKPSSKKNLDVPAISKIEATSSPKEVLRAALLIASETTGRRRRQQQRLFSSHRRNLLQRLDIDGPISNLPSWQRLRADLLKLAMAEGWTSAGLQCTTE